MRVRLILMLTLITGLLVLFSGLVFPVFAKQNNVQAENEVLSTATLKDDFEDDAVIVVLNKEASHDFKKYTIEDFNEIDSKSIEDLTELQVEVIKQQLAAEKSGNWSGLKERIDSGMLMDIDSFRRILRIELKAKNKENVLNAIRELEKRDDILSAEPDYIYETAATPNDPNYVNGYQWGLDGTSGGIQAPQAWNITTGHAPVKVGVLDSGIDGQHEDLINVINDDLHRDYVDTPLFSNVRIIDKNDLTDSSSNGHGTKVAGIIGAEANNSLGILGVCWNVRLISLRVVNASGKSTAARITRAVDFATENNIPILNLSSGGGSFSDLWNSLETAIQNYPGLFVCSAGNNNIDNDTNPSYPSNYRLPNLISVGAIRSSGWRWELSNYGATTVDIFAPGHDILSTTPGNNYTNDSGTSLAAPFVTGTAALIKSVRPYLTASQIKTAIMSNAVTDDEDTPLDGLCVSNGRLNAFKAISSVVFETHLLHSGVGISIGGFINGYSMPQNTHLILPEKFARLGDTEQRDVVEIGFDYSYSIQQNTDLVTFEGLSRLGDTEQRDFIEAGVFSNQINLISIEIPDTVTKIGPFAFMNCTNLTNITLPNSVTQIQSNAFENCTSLASITLPENLTSIGFFAFKGCTSLGSITIPDSVTCLNPHVFENCTSLTNITLSNNLTSIKSSAFKGCTSLGSIIIPNSVADIQFNAFENCTSLANINLSNNLTNIGDSAFKGCTSLNNIVIPTSVINIGNNAFYECTSLTNIVREFNINASSSNYYYLTIQNIGNAIVKIDGVITTSVNNNEVIYLSSGNHIVTVEATVVFEIMSIPTIAVAVSQTETIYYDDDNLLNFFTYQNIFDVYNSVQIGVMIDEYFYDSYTFYDYVFYSDWSHPEGSFNIHIYTGGITVGGDLGLVFERAAIWYITGTYFS